MRLTGFVNRILHPFTHTDQKSKETQLIQSETTVKTRTVGASIFSFLLSIPTAIKHKFTKQPADSPQGPVAHSASEINKVIQNPAAQASPLRLKGPKIPIGPKGPPQLRGPSVEKQEGTAWGVKYRTKGSNQQQMRREIFQQTKSASQKGYKVGDKTIKPDDPKEVIRKQKDVALYINSDALPPLQKEAPSNEIEVIRVVNQDTLDAAIEMKEKRNLNPLVLNMANAYRAGGGAEEGDLAQEEDLLRRTDSYRYLDPKHNKHLGEKMKKQMKRQYQLPQRGGVYTPGVKIIREGLAKNFDFIKPVEVDMVAVAAYNRNPLGGGKRDVPKKFLGLMIDEEEYERGTKEKIRFILRTAIATGHDSLVLGAMGCGAFSGGDPNLPARVAKMYSDVLMEDDFRGKFKEVTFAILENKKNKGNDNYAAFKKVFHPHRDQIKIVP
jgi:uncharacterized protein (TIGR02452 family)